MGEGVRRRVGWVGVLVCWCACCVVLCCVCLSQCVFVCLCRFKCRCESMGRSDNHLRAQRTGRLLLRPGARRQHPRVRNAHRDENRCTSLKTLLWPSANRVFTNRIVAKARAPTRPCNALGSPNYSIQTHVQGLRESAFANTPSRGHCPLRARRAAAAKYTACSCSLHRPQCLEETADHRCARRAQPPARPIREYAAHCLPERLGQGSRACGRGTS